MSLIGYLFTCRLWHVTMKKGMDSWLLNLLNKMLLMHFSHVIVPVRKGPVCLNNISGLCRVRLKRWPVALRFSEGPPEIKSKRSAGHPEISENKIISDIKKPFSAIFMFMFPYKHFVSSIMREHWLNRNDRSKIWSDERFYDYSENCPEIQGHLI